MLVPRWGKRGEYLMLARQYWYQLHIALHISREPHFSAMFRRTRTIIGLYVRLYQPLRLSYSISLIKNTDKYAAYSIL